MSEPLTGLDEAEEPITPEFRARLIAAVERPLRVRRAIMLLAGHASGHLPGGSDRGCRCCMRDWPCEEVFRAARSALDAFADCEPPAANARFAAAVRADERAKVLAALDAVVAKTAAFAGQAEDVRYARACVIRALAEPTP